MEAHRTVLLALEWTFREGGDGLRGLDAEVFPLREVRWLWHLGFRIPDLVRVPWASIGRNTWYLEVVW